MKKTTDRRGAGPVPGPVPPGLVVTGGMAPWCEGCQAHHGEGLKYESCGKTRGTDVKVSEFPDVVFTGFANPRAKKPACAVCEGSLAAGSSLVVLSATEIAHASCYEGTKVAKTPGDFVVTIYEIHAQRIKISADSPEAALKDTKEGDGDYERRNGDYVTEFVSTSDIEPKVERAEDAAAWRGDDYTKRLTPIVDAKRSGNSSLFQLVGLKPVLVTEAMLGAAEAVLSEPEKNDPDCDEWRSSQRMP